MKKQIIRKKLEEKTRSDLASSCKIWEGTLCRGYGTVSISGKNFRAARLAFEIEKGPIPPGCVIHHTCFNTKCVNSKHLKPMPQSEHMKIHAERGVWNGQNNSQAKLTRTQVIEIKKRGKLLGEKPKIIAEDFDVTLSNVHSILAGKSWSHINIIERKAA